MIRTLFIIAGSAFLLCILAFGGAAALGGADIRRNGWSFTVDEQDGRTTVRRGGREAVETPSTERTVAWTGSDTLTLDLPADVTFVQGAAANVRLEGPQAVVDRIRVEGSRISMDEGGDRTVVAFTGTGIEGWSDSDRVRIVVTAPDVTRFRIEGSSDLRIQDYDQDVLDIAINGSGDVEGAGRAATLTLDIGGSGDADLSDLELSDARVTIRGSGDARVGATGSVEAELSGSGDLDLTDRPARLTQSVTGSGDVGGR